MNTVNTDIAAYYTQRAERYEQIYDRPERQADLALLRQRLADVLESHHVLELACGTGYWTAQIAGVAESVLATDINPAMIEMARRKQLDPERVQFGLMDAYNLQPEREFTACFNGFLWSHVKRQDQAALLEQWRNKLGKDALLVMIDNTYVEDSSTPIARTDLDGNTYQIRALDGERYEVLKNFPTDSALRKKLTPALKEIRILRLQHYWMLTGKFK